MTEEIMKKLEQRLDRRSFLRGSSLAAVGLLGAALPRIAEAQTPAPQEKPAEKPADKKDPEKKDPEKKEEKPAEKPAETTKKEEEEDPFKVTKLDEKGKPYRVCPQCGYNMYQQDKLWNCENCGYSYTE